MLYVSWEERKVVPTRGPDILAISATFPEHVASVADVAGPGHGPLAPSAHTDPDLHLEPGYVLLRECELVAVIGGLRGLGLRGASGLLESFDPRLP